MATVRGWLRVASEPSAKHGPYFVWTDGVAYQLTTVEVEDAVAMPDDVREAMITLACYVVQRGLPLHMGVGKAADDVWEWLDPTKVQERGGGDAE